MWYNLFDVLISNPKALLLRFGMASISKHFQDLCVQYNNCVMYKKWEQALQIVQEMIKLNPQRSKSYTYRGFLYYKLGKWDRAQRDLNHALLLNPDTPDAIKWLKKLEQKSENSDPKKSEEFEEETMVIGDILGTNGGGDQEKTTPKSIAKEETIDLRGATEPGDNIAEEITINLRGVTEPESPGIAEEITIDLRGVTEPESPGIAEEKTIDLRGVTEPESPSIAEEKTIDLRGVTEPESPDIAEEKTIDLRGVTEPESPSIAEEITIDLRSVTEPESPDIAEEKTIDLRKAAPKNSPPQPPIKEPDLIKPAKNTKLSKAPSKEIKNKPAGARRDKTVRRLKNKTSTERSKTIRRVKKTQSRLTRYSTTKANTKLIDSGDIWQEDSSKSMDKKSKVQTAMQNLLPYDHKRKSQKLPASMIVLIIFVVLGLLLLGIWMGAVLFTPK